VIRRSWSQVEELVGRAVASAPDDPRTIVFQAEMMMLNGEADKALDLMKAALDREPTQALFWEAYAQTLVDTGRIDEAVSLLQKATSQDPTSDRVKLRIMYARLLDALGRTAEAHSVLTRDLDRLPMGDRAMLWLTLGDLYLIRGNLQDARKAFVQGSKLLPDDPMPLLHLLDMSLNEESGNPIERDGTIRESLEELSRISDESGPYYGLGRAMVLLETASRQTGSVRDQKLDEAKKLIDRARSKFPKERYPHILEGRYQSLVGKPEEAILAYEQAMNCVGGEIVEPQLRALYEELGRRADLVRLRRRHSQQPPSLDRFAAESYIRQGEPGKASEQAASIVERDPDNLEVRVWQSRLLKSIGRTDEAEKTLRELVEREPNQIGPRIALLYFLVGMQKHEEARKLIETIEEMPNLSRPEFVLARCWSITGEIDRA
ncbi:MAG TPA: tetratricopeptide repeat protein, partial [Isosphaeraceae bacterium]|nr:tetratricopeptide repeat protein [Isosphaeraceae bacterium]